MAESQLQFDRRVRKLERKHAALRRGCEAMIRPDGLVVMRPRRQGPRVSLRGLGIFLAALVATKAFLLFSVGDATYQERLDRLSSGTPVERIGAVVMTPDPASVWLSGRLHQLKLAF